MYRCFLFSICVLLVITVAKGEHLWLESCLFGDARQINEGDVLLVKVLDPLSAVEIVPAKEVFVPKAGIVELPMVGQVEVKGRAMGEFRKEITTLYKVKNDGQVFVSLVHKVPQEEPNVGTEGFVSFPMRHRWKDGMTLLEAICNSGGIDPRGNHRKVRVLRAGEAISIDLSNPAARKMLLHPGDRLVVP